MKISNIILAVLIGGLALSMVVDIATSKMDGVNIEGVALSGKKATRTYETLALKHLNVEGPIKVILSAGIPQLSIEADENLLDQLADGDEDPETLSISLPSNMQNVGEIIAYLSTPTLETISLSGSGSIETPDTLPYLHNTITLNGNAHANLSYSGAEFLRIAGSGGTSASLSGTTEKLVAGLSGGNEIKAGELIAKVVEINGSGSTNARVHADSILNFSASGSSTLQYTGTPKVSFSSSGSGRMEAI